MTKTYTAYFYTDANYAYDEIEAETPEQALAKAREMNDADEITHFDSYDQAPPVNHIEILDQDRNELAHWYDADMHLRITGPELLAALEAIIPYAENEAAALDDLKDSPVAETEAERARKAVDQARAVIAKAKGVRP